MNTVNKIPAQMVNEFNSEPWNYYEERQLLPETDYKLEAMKIASTLKNDSLDKLLVRYHEIYKILTEKTKNKTWVQEQDEILNKKWQEQQQKAIDNCYSNGG